MVNAPKAEEGESEAKPSPAKVIEGKDSVKTTTKAKSDKMSETAKKDKAPSSSKNSEALSEKEQSMFDFKDN